MEQSGQPNGDRNRDDERQRTNLVFLAVAVVVVVVGVWLVNTMIDMRRMQECAESGRHNCAPIATPGRQTY